MTANGYLKNTTAKPEQPSRSRLRLFVSSTPGLALIYFCAITIAESTTVLFEPRIGLILHGFVLVAILMHSALLSRGTQQSFLLSLILAPLVRLLSLSLPLTSFRFVYWYAVIGAPLFLAAMFTARVIGLDRVQIGLTLKALPFQLFFGLVGIGLGYIEYTILRPAPLTTGPTLKEIWLPALILLIFTGLLEEVIFRGVMYYVSLRSLGRPGIIYVAAIFAVLHLGYKSISDVIFVFAVALFFGIIAFRTGSILGVTLAHGLTNIGLFLVFPFAIGPANLNLPSPTSQPLSPTAIVTSTHAYTQLSPTARPTIKPTQSSGVSSPITVTLTAMTPTLSSSTATMTFAPSSTPSLTATPQITDTAFPSQTITPTPVNTVTSTPSLSATVQPTVIATVSPSSTPLLPTQTTTLTSPPPNQVVIDDGDLGFLRSGGEQYSSPQGFGGDFIWTTTTNGNARVQVEWRPILSMCGIYKVEVFIPAGINLTKSAFYQVGFRSGMSSRLMDQSAHPGEWVSLGEYEFLPTSGTFLRLTNSTGEIARPDLAITFDAARWTLVAACSTGQP